MGQKGFTLVEVLVVLAVGGVLLTGSVLSIHQIMTATSRNNSQVVVLDEVNRAALQLKKDLQSRDSANISVDSDLIKLDWINNTAFDPEGPQLHSATYSLSDTGELLRTSGNTTSIVARQIESISYSENGMYIDVVITATSANFPHRSQTLSFSVGRRSEETQ